jgi:hypothetical protein
MSEKVREYNIADTYKEGETIHHKIYGTGEVMEIKKTEGEHDMVIVRFGIEGDKEIVMNYKAPKEEAKA